MGQPDYNRFKHIYTNGRREGIRTETHLQSQEHDITRGKKNGNSAHAAIVAYLVFFVVFSVNHHNSMSTYDGQKSEKCYYTPSSADTNSTNLIYSNTQQAI